MFGGKPGRRAARFVIGDQVDPALAPQLHLFGPVIGDMGKAHPRKDGFQRAGIGRAEFDEFEPVEAKRVVKQIGGMRHSVRRRFQGGSPGCDYTQPYT